MFESKDTSFELVYGGNRRLVVNSAPVRPIKDFPQSILGLIALDLTCNKILYNCLNNI